MKKFNDYISESLVTEPEEGLPIKLQQRYRLEKGDIAMEFYVMSIDEEKDEAYMKVVVPGSAHQGITLTSLLAAEPVEVDEPENNEE